jgi:hypothetical protein
MEFENIYKRIAFFEGIDIKNKQGAESHSMPIDKEKRRCLFCGRAYPEVNIPDTSHAISEAIGNKILINHYECNECNKAFGSLLEDSFGKYVQPYKFISQIYGKKSTMTIKDFPIDSPLGFGSYRLQSRKNSNAIKEDGNIANYIIEKQGTGILHETNEGFSLVLSRQKYDPRLVYASLLKMGYSIMPFNELENSVRGMLTLGAYATKREPFDNIGEAHKYITGLPAKGIIAFYPGRNPLNGVSVHLFCKRQDSPKDYTRYMFRLDFVNYSILIPILSDNELSSDFMLPIPKFRGAQLRDIDFTTEEKTVCCEFSADKIELPSECYNDLEKRLREQNLLNSVDNKN